MGSEIPRDYPKKYTENLQRVDIFNASMAWDMDELRRWQKRHGTDLSRGQVEIFERYLKTDHAIRLMVIEHPKVNRPEEYQDHSVVLQRGVIVYDKGRETLFLRSYVHSAKRGRDSTRGSADFVNFAPKGGVQMVFSSNTLWFPLETTNGCVAEAASYVMLDILTPTALDVSQLPKPFQLEKKGRTQYQGRSYQVTRVAAKLAAKERWPDLSLKP
jgi:hypothetical protein